MYLLTYKGRRDDISVNLMAFESAEIREYQLIFAVDIQFSREDLARQKRTRINKKVVDADNHRQISPFISP